MVLALHYDFLLHHIYLSMLKIVLCTPQMVLKVTRTPTPIPEALI